MVKTLLLLGCALVPGQAADRVMPVRGVVAGQDTRRDAGDWFLAPRLLRSQELVYHGSYSEDSDSAGVHFSRAYHLDLRAFVLDVTRRGPEVAFLTTWRLRDQPNQPGHADAPPNAVRLQVATVDILGKVVPPAGVRLQVPLDAMPAAEVGIFVETPDRKLGANDVWEVGEDGRPATNWQVIGMEQLNGAGCIKLVGVQQSDDWDKPRADRASWRRTDTVWMSSRLGVAVRVDRQIECREAARREVSWKSSLRYELESSMQFPGALSDERRQEIARARTYAESAVPLIAAPTRSPAQLTTLLNKINFALDNTPATPYRDAVLQVRRRLEAARRGEVVVAAASDPRTKANVANVGELAPDFVAPDIINHDSARLQRWRGKPILLVFYHPASVNANDLLRFGQRLQTTYANRMTVVGLAVTDEVDQVPAQRTALGLTFPLLKGNGLRISYVIDATPKMVLIDPHGFVRGSWIGWGNDVADEVGQELRRWLPPELDKGTLTTPAPSSPIREIPPSR